MIQRIQSLYLSVAVILLSLMLLVPVAKVANLASEATNLVEANKLLLAELGALHYLAIAAGIITLFSIFMFRNRPLQIRIATLALLVNFALLVWEAVALYMHQKDLSELESFSLSFGAFLPFVALIFISLAISRIRKDEKIVRSMDRLR